MQDKSLWSSMEVPLLIILSLPSDLQIEAMGYGNVEEEIAIDFESHFMQHKASFIKHGYFTESETRELSKIDAIAVSVTLCARFEDFAICLPTSRNIFNS